MYKFELYFKSDMECIYTKWEETADSERWFLMKLNRVLEYWSESFKLPAEIIDFSLSEEIVKSVLRNKYLRIQDFVNKLNAEGFKDRKRSFTISIYKKDKDSYSEIIDFLDNN